MIITGIDCKECVYKKKLEELEQENALLKEQNTLQRKELKGYHCQEKFPGQCHCAFKCLENSFCIRAEERINKLKEENALLKEELLKKSETEQSLQSTIEAIQDANKRINQCTEALRQINEIIKHYHLKVGGEVVGSETIYKIEQKVKELLS